MSNRCPAPHARRSIQAAGGLPQPQVTTFNVHNSHFNART
jgi:hypothetical protein